MNEQRSCPGIPEQCEHSRAVMSRVLEGFPDSGIVEAAQRELSQCLSCLQQIDFEVRFKLAMSQRATDQAPPSLQLRISDALGRIDLSEIDVTDL
jgi:hypothetical protein